MGGDPSHPELLDWLASELVANGWHLKPIQRLMVLSATYCQSSTGRSRPPPRTPPRIAADAADNLLWHFRRQRLEGEELRDAELQVSGELNLRMYRPQRHARVAASPRRHALRLGSRSKGGRSQSPLDLRARQAQHAICRCSPRSISPTC